MSKEQPVILVTGAGGQLGRLVIDSLLSKVRPEQIVAAVRKPDPESGFSSKGVTTRVADYRQPETLQPALEGVDRVLLVSSNDLKGRVAQHRNVIEAARRAGVTLFAYTSILRADTSPLRLADDHRETEKLLSQSGLPSVFLRNGWYTENHTGSLAPALAHGAILGSSGEGRFSTAARADYAEAAAVALTSDRDADTPNRIYELAGDGSYSMPEFTAEVARASGKPVAYQNLGEAEYASALAGFGLPAELAEVLADSDAKAANGHLFDDGRQLSRLIGRPTTPWDSTVEAAIQALR